jgi:hypothetical protein
MTGNQKLTFMSQLFINGQMVHSGRMKRDAKQSNRFVCREWIAIPAFPEKAKVKIIIYDGSTLLSEIALEPDVFGKKFTSNIDDGSLYSWGVLTRGYGPTWGFTLLPVTRSCN